MLVLLWIFVSTVVYAEINENDELNSDTKGLRPPPRIGHFGRPLVITASPENIEDITMTRRRREINEDILDEEAANEIFGSERRKAPQHQHIGPPAPPDPSFYRKQMLVLATGQAFETQSGPALFERGSRALPPTTNVVPYDISVDPNYPVQAPRARALADEFSQNQVDEEFRTGYRWRSNPARTLTLYQSPGINQNWRRSPIRSGQQPSGFFPSRSYTGSQSPYGIAQGYVYDSRALSTNYRGTPQYFLG
ncbi:hypothetical protein V3C99_013252 [Haemonchus contortus]